MANDKKEYQPGPYNETTVKTFKIGGPIEISITETHNSSHVPPVGGCGCGGGGGVSIADIMQAVQAVASSATTPPIVETDPHDH